MGHYDDLYYKFLKLLVFVVHNCIFNEVIVCYCQQMYYSLMGLIFVKTGKLPLTDACNYL